MYCNNLSNKTGRLQGIDDQCLDQWNGEANRGGISCANDNRQLFVKYNALDSWFGVRPLCYLALRVFASLA